MYPEAKRLLNLLRSFLAISSELVPRDSILREFIGGSIFKEYKEKQESDKMIKVAINGFGRIGRLVFRRL